MKHIILVACILITSVLSPAKGLGCSSFHMSDRNLSIVGKNYDWMVQGGLIFINKRDVKKTAFVRHEHETNNPAEWTSKYGSVTFCQYGVELPAGGMNEKGLAVSSQALPGSRYPELDGRPSIERRQWLQYQLDNYASVAEVVINFDKIQVRPDSFGEHYFVADAGGNSAVIEFIYGEVKTYIGRTLPHHVLTNTEYRSSAGYYKKALPEVDPHRNIERFVTAAKRIKTAKKAFISKPVEEAFQLLNDISQGEFTKWSIVYDTKNRQIFFRSLGNADIRWFNLKMFDLSCNTPTQMLKIEQIGEGDVTGQFKDFNIGVAFAVVYSSFEQSTFLQTIDPQQVLHRVTHAGRHTCTKPITKKDIASRSGETEELNDEAAVGKIIDVWEIHWNNRDVENLMSLIHKDAQIMYGWREIADKRKYSFIVEERMRAVGQFNFSNRKIKMSDNRAMVELLLKIGWGEFPSTFTLKKENDRWLITSFKYKI